MPVRFLRGRSNRAAEGKLCEAGVANQGRVGAKGDQDFVYFNRLRLVRLDHQILDPDASMERTVLLHP